MLFISWVALLCVWLPPCIYGYARGPYSMSCTRMMPGHGSSPQTEDSPVTFTLSQPCYRPTDRIKVDITSKNTEFKGFMVEARSGSKTDMAYGSFSIGDSSKQKLIDCFGGKNNAISHKNSIKVTSTYFYWEPGQDDSVDVAFTVSVVQSFRMYWVGLKSSVIKRCVETTPVTSMATTPTTMTAKSTSIATTSTTTTKATNTTTIATGQTTMATPPYNVPKTSTTVKERPTTTKVTSTFPIASKKMQNNFSIAETSDVIPRRMEEIITTSKGLSSERDSMMTTKGVKRSMNNHSAIKMEVELRVRLSGADGVQQPVVIKGNLSLSNAKLLQQMFDKPEEKSLKKLRKAKAESSDNEVMFQPQAVMSSGSQKDIFSQFLCYYCLMTQIFMVLWKY